MQTKFNIGDTVIPNGRTFKNFVIKHIRIDVGNVVSYSNSENSFWFREDALNIVEPTFRIGNIFSVTNTVGDNDRFYMLSQIAAQHIALINLASGNRLVDSIKTLDPLYISKSDINQIQDMLSSNVITFVADSLDNFYASRK